MNNAADFYVLYKRLNTDLSIQGATSSSFRSIVTESYLLKGAIFKEKLWKGRLHGSVG